MIRFTKKTIITLFLILILSISAYAADGFEIGQVKAKLPNIDVEIITEDDIDLQSVSAELDSSLLKTVSVSEAGEENVTTDIYVLIDISNSVKTTELECVKTLVKDYSQQFQGTQNKLSVFTFGSTLTQLTEPGFSAQQVVEKLDEIEFDYNGTDFFGAITKVHSKATSSTADRQIIIVFSDGYDEDIKGNESYEETVEKINSHSVPVYAMCLSGATAHASQIFGNIARSSGGTIVVFNEENASQKFQELQSRIDSSKILRLSTDSNIPVGHKNLTVRIGEEKKVVEIYATEYEADDEAPKAVSCVWNKEQQCFEISFSENVIISDNETSFIIKNEKGKVIGIKQIAGENTLWKLYTGETIYSGTYTVEFSAITDTSFEKNLLAESQITLEVEGKNPALKILKFWWVLVPFIFLGALWAILLHVKKKKNVKTIKEIFETQYEVQYEQEFRERKKEVNVVKAQEPVKMNHITLYVCDGRGVMKKMQVEFYRSIIVGRGTGCEVVIADNRMSRQHFAIEKNDRVWVLKDLKTTNGTFLNGIRVADNQVIRTGDKISAGNMTITVEF